MKFSAADMQFMRTAMELAERGQFTVAPNPLVGCIIVSADDRIIGQGWHTAFGQAHAEVEAYQSVSPADQPLLAESTWYVTLEPCNHVGQTPACAAFMDRITPKRVVIGVRDSNPAVAGGGIERLRAAGIQVDVGCLEVELAWQNRRFLWNAETKRPWVVLKWAESRDGYMDGRPLQERQPARWVPNHGGNRSPLDTHVACVGTGHRRWREYRIGGHACSTCAALRLYAHAARSSGLIKWSTLIQRNDNLIYVVGPPKAPNEAQLPWEVKEGLDALLERLYEFNLSSLLVEGGATVLNDFLKQDAWNEIKCWRSPAATGGGLLAPSIPDHSLPLPHGLLSSGQLGIDAWTNRLHSRHASD